VYLASGVHLSEAPSPHRFLFEVLMQFCRFGIRSNTQCITPVYALPQSCILIEMKQGECICPHSWSVNCNFVRDGNYIDRGWACNPHPYQPGLIFHVIRLCRILRGAPSQGLPTFLKSIWSGLKKEKTHFSESSFIFNFFSPLNSQPEFGRKRQNKKNIL
jgi:hypothetical protein